MGTKATRLASTSPTQTPAAPGNNQDARLTVNNAEKMPSAGDHHTQFRDPRAPSSERAVPAPLNTSQARNPAIRAYSGQLGSCMVWSIGI